MRKNNRKLISCLIFATTLIAVTTVVIFLIFSMNGNVKKFGISLQDETDESISCTTKDINYPFFTYDNAISKNTEIKMVFNEDRLVSIYLVHEMFYADNSASASEASNRASMNKSFGSTYGPDAFNANYHTSNTEMRMSLYANAKGLGEDAKKYFLASNTTNVRDSLVKNYQNQGFICRTNNQKAWEGD